MTSKTDTAQRRRKKKFIKICFSISIFANIKEKEIENPKSNKPDWEKEETNHIDQSLHTF